jgi:hypothetical protein
VYNEMFKHALAKRGLSKRRHRESRLKLPKALEPWARAKTAEQIQVIEASGAAIVGDLDDLLPVFDANGDQPANVSSVAVLDAALDGLVALAKDRFEDAARLRGRLDRLRAEKAREDEDLTAMRGELERATTRPVRFTLVRLSEQRAWLGAARRAYQRAARLVRPSP